MKSSQSRSCTGDAGPHQMSVLLEASENISWEAVEAGRNRSRVTPGANKYNVSPLVSKDQKAFSSGSSS